MYESHWGLREPPFRGSLDPDHYYKTPTHDEALARLQYLVDNHRRLGLLVGPHGSGKSLLQSVFARDLRRLGRVVVSVNLLGMSAAELEWSVASQLGTKPRRDAATFHIWRTIADRLVENRYQQIGTVFLLDDADQASPEVLTLVNRLIQIDPSPDSRLTVIVAGDCDRVGQLGDRLLERVELRIDLEAWQETETADYLEHCLASAGVDTSVFDDRASTRLHDLCHGIPRQVNQLAHLALLAGAGRQLSNIDEETIESVYHELLATAVR